MRAEGWQTLVIISPTTGNGKTLTALNLAISLSQEVNQTVLLVDRSDSPRLKIGGGGFLIEVVDSDRQMIDRACGLSGPQDEKALPKYELVIALALVHLATEYTLVEIGGFLQIADLHGDVIDTAPLESGGRHSAGAGG